MSCRNVLTDRKPPESQIDELARSNRERGLKASKARKHQNYCRFLM